MPAEECPNPKTCRYYTFTSAPPARYSSGPDGTVRISYWVNASGLDTSTISAAQAESAIKAGFETWQRAAPSLRFMYEGRTDRPAVLGDGVNVVSFQGAGAFTDVGGVSGHPEFDMRLGPNGWVWAPCEQRDNSCTPQHAASTTGDAMDLQSAVTHEAGHALWLGHPSNASLHRELTMWPGDGDQLGSGRQWSTLALGDVLGVRELYPCSCPLPPIYSP